MSVRKYLKESIRLGDKELTVETGRVAKQADGSVVIRYGDTMLLVAAVGAQTEREGIDFFPLTVEYRESNYAAGRIPGNYFRREGRPNEKEVLTCRLIDRPCRPLFAEGYKNETQVIATVISADPDNNPDVIAITGTSCALYLSDIPFLQPIAGVRIGLIEGRYVVNPTYDEVRDSRLNLIVAGTEEAIVMVEAGAQEVSEEIMVEALMLAHKEINRLCRWQKELYKALDVQKREVVPPVLNEEMMGEIARNYGDRLQSALDTSNQDKRASYAAVDALKKEVVESYPEDQIETRQMAKKIFDHLKETIFRDDILNNRRRPDGRRFGEIRPITCEVGWLPRVHGSALFTRGETQAMVTTTLGTKEDEQFMDDLEKGEVKRRFLLHYNFPHYSVGEALSTPMTPPINSINRLDTTSPIPVPATLPTSWPSRLNGLKSWVSFSGDNPAPVSLTLNRMRSGTLTLHSTSTVPCSLLYLIALDTRLMTTCFKRVRSAFT